MGDNQEDIKQRRDGFLANLPRNYPECFKPAFDKES
jgi:hypothetical protein